MISTFVYVSLLYVRVFGSPDVRIPKHVLHPRIEIVSSKRGQMYRAPLMYYRIDHSKAICISFS